jgi:DNA-directed RNA polymerase specialized sigma24 family protein
MRLTVLNLIRDEARRIARQPKSVELLDEHPCERRCPLRAAIGSEIRARYLRALRAIAPRDAALVVARVEQGRYAKDIARAFGFSTPAAAGIAVRRALMRLRREFGEP